MINVELSVDEVFDAVSALGGITAAMEQVVKENPSPYTALVRDYLETLTKLQQKIVNAHNAVVK